MEEIKNKLTKSEEKLLEDFNELFDSSGEKMNKFHDELIKISSKNPEMIDIIKFIIFVTDNIDTSHKKLSSLTLDKLEENYQIKRDIIKKIEEIKNQKPKPKFSWNNILTNVKEIKVILGIGSVFVLIIGVIFFPERLDDIKNLIKFVFHEIF